MRMDKFVHALADEGDFALAPCGVDAQPLGLDHARTVQCAVHAAACGQRANLVKDRRIAWVQHCCGAHLPGAFDTIGH